MSKGNLIQLIFIFSIFLGIRKSVILSFLIEMDYKEKTIQRYLQNNCLLMNSCYQKTEKLQATTFNQALQYPEEEILLNLPNYLAVDLEKMIRVKTCTTEDSDSQDCNKQNRDSQQLNSFIFECSLQRQPLQDITSKIIAIKPLRVNCSLTAYMNGVFPKRRQQRTIMVVKTIRI